MTLLKKSRNVFPQSFSDFFEEDPFMNFKGLSNLGKWMPAVNIKDTAEGYLVDMSVPGFEKDSFKVELDGDILTVHGEIKKESSEEEENYTRKEFTRNSFKRSFTIPDHADTESISCAYENGVLKLNIPKKNVEPQQASKRNISIK
jgi:HSP20 family protein